MAFLEGFATEDLGLFLNDQDFVGVQDATERFNQEITWRSAWGHKGPVLRSIRPADEATFRFSAVLLKAGVERGLNDEDVLKAMTDFEVKVRRGDKAITRRGCNWREVSVDYGQNEVMLNADISIPGFPGDF